MDGTAECDGIAIVPLSGSRAMIAERIQGDLAQSLWPVRFPDSKACAPACCFQRNLCRHIETAPAA